MAIRTYLFIPRSNAFGFWTLIFVRREKVASRMGGWASTVFYL